MSYYLITVTNCFNYCFSWYDAFVCTEYKTFVSNKTGKEAAKDAPSWVKQAGHKPCKNPNENGNQFAKRILDEKYGAGNWKTGPETEHNQIKKYGDRAFK